MLSYIKGSESQLNFVVLSSPPLWIVAIHDLWVSSRLILVDDVTVLCVVLDLKWMTWLDYFDFSQIWYLRCSSTVTFNVLYVSAFGCPSLTSVASSGCFSFLSMAFQEQEFLQKQQQDLDGALKKIIQQHKLEIATIERDCLNHKQQLMRGKMNSAFLLLSLNFWFLILVYYQNHSGQVCFLRYVVSCHCFCILSVLFTSPATMYLYVCQLTLA